MSSTIHACSSPPDEVAIMRAMGGERLPLTPVERREAARRLDRRGHTRAEIAELLGCCKRTVERAIYPRAVAQQPSTPLSELTKTA